MLVERQLNFWPKLFLFAASVVIGCDRNPAVTSTTSATDSSPQTTAPNMPAPAADRIFDDVTAAVGLPPNPDPYADGTFLLPEMEPGGVALLDYNNDGLLDILTIRHPPPGPDQFKSTNPNRLYRQLKDGHFVEVPAPLASAAPAITSASPSVTLTTMVSPTSTSPTTPPPTNSFIIMATAPSPTSPQKPGFPLRQTP